jgi:hypothetical protein
MDPWNVYMCNIEEKLDVKSQLEKSERIVDIWQNVRFAHISIHIGGDITDGITLNAKSGTKCLCSKTTTVLFD